MKLRKWLTWLSWSVLALWIMSTMIGNDKADRLFDCIYNQWCNKRIFGHLRSCWLILSSETKGVIQSCAMSTCKLHLSDYFSMDDLCGSNLSYSKKRDCFLTCAHIFVDYVKRLENEAYFSNAYQTLVHAHNCFSPFLKICAVK